MSETTHTYTRLWSINNRKYLAIRDSTSELVSREELMDVSGEISLIPGKIIHPFLKLANSSININKLKGSNDRFFSICEELEGIKNIEPEKKMEKLELFYLIREIAIACMQSSNVDTNIYIPLIIMNLFQDRENTNTCSCMQPTFSDVLDYHNSFDPISMYENISSGMITPSRHGYDDRIKTVVEDVYLRLFNWHFKEKVIAFNGYEKYDEEEEKILEDFKKFLYHFYIMGFSDLNTTMTKDENVADCISTIVIYLSYLSGSSVHRMLDLIRYFAK